MDRTRSHSFAVQFKFFPGPAVPIISGLDVPRFGFLVQSVIQTFCPDSSWSDKKMDQKVRNKQQCLEISTNPPILNGPDFGPIRTIMIVSLAICPGSPDGEDLTKKFVDKSFQMHSISSMFRIMITLHCPVT